MTGGGPERATASSHRPATHLPVMYRRVLDSLRVSDDGTWLDGTFGRGGHARGVLQQLGPGGRLLLMDKDPDAITVALREFGSDVRVSIRRGSFAGLAQWDATADGLDGVLLDLGVSSPQLDVAQRGFSFGKDGPLDMRMDPDAGPSAADWLAQADDREIADVLWKYGEERHSRRIARAIVAAREQQPLTRTGQLAELIAAVMPRGSSKIHPATRSFQAIRIFINRELADLEAGLDAAHARLKPGGRLVVISFHSLEDRIVKQFIARHAKPPPANRRMPVEIEFTPSLRPLGGAHKATEAEIAENPRARSAVLRVAERLGFGIGDSGFDEAKASTGATPGESGQASLINGVARPLLRIPNPESRIPASGAGP